MAYALLHVHLLLMVVVEEQKAITNLVAPTGQTQHCSPPLFLLLLG